MVVTHLNAGALEFQPLVRDDVDRLALVRFLVRGLGESLLAFCVMDSHLHVVASGNVPARQVTAQAVANYVQWFNGRHGRSGKLLRGPVHATPKTTGFEVARAIHYVHENPVNAELVASAIEWPWGSARAFAGLAATDFPNVAAARAAAKKHARRVSIAAPPLAELEPTEARTRLELLLVAVGQTYFVEPLEVVGRSRLPEVLEARAAFVQLARLDGWTPAEIAARLERARSRECELAQVKLPARSLRCARTLLRTPVLAARLEGPARRIGPPALPVPVTSAP